MNNVFDSIQKWAADTLAVLPDTGGNMKRVAFVLPYYGRFPSYFQLFLDSCGGNPDFDWLVFTDDHYPYDYPDNVHVRHETFEDMRRRVMGRIDAPVNLDSPYKLCDFKPTYGLVFSEYLQEYD